MTLRRARLVYGLDGTGNVVYVDDSNPVPVKFVDAYYEEDITTGDGTSHAVNHGLNFKWVDVMVVVDVGGGTYREVEPDTVDHVDADNTTVTLSVPIDGKIIFKK